MEQRGYIIQPKHLANQRWEELFVMAKSFRISEQMVWNAYLKVKANNGSAGIDMQTMEDFDKNLKSNLYKIWNRLSSGSYIPPAVRRVEIPKSNGKVRPLGIPTISDRIAQMVVKEYLEPFVEPFFHNDSYGYRPGKSALDAVAQARQRCWRDDWVLDLDIKSFFDTIDHDLAMKAVSQFTQCKWVLLYIRRWLNADVVMPNGNVEKGVLGTPQGGVISPLLANIFLHFVFDKWMEIHYPTVNFERYADDIVVHCRSQKQVQFIKQQIENRFKQCKLALCPEKTRVVYCKDSNRKDNYSTMNFDFLGYTFRPRSSRAKNGTFFVSFSPAVSQKSMKAMRTRIKEHPIIKGGFSEDLQTVARAINPIIQGWINYYGRFRKSSLSSIFLYINDKLTRWVMRKYKSLQRRKKRAGEWLRRLYIQNRMLFVHWRVWNWVTE
jgi:RNA-directed DNA polymerase